MNNNEVKVDFDDYVDTYEKILDEQLGFFVDSRDYYSEYKVEVASKLLSNHKVSRILDFGCGIGLSFPFLKKFFPNAILYGSDTSLESLNYAKEKYPFVNILDELVASSDFDLIFITGVFHHIAPQERPEIIKKLYSMLRPSGHLIVFEHNPFNPLTRHIVSNCVFDADAKLITKNSLSKLIKSNATFCIDNSGYTLFFPQTLKFLHKLEGSLGWLPLGGQYFIMASRK